MTDRPVRWWRWRRAAAGWRRSAALRCWSSAKRRRPCCSGCRTICRSQGYWARRAGSAYCKNSTVHSIADTPGTLCPRHLDPRCQSVPPRLTRPDSRIHRPSFPPDPRRQTNYNIRRQHRWYFNCSTTLDHYGLGLTRPATFLRLRPPATKERAVAYTRRPSCCESRLHSATCYIRTPDVSLRYNGVSLIYHALTLASFMNDT